MAETAQAQAATIDCSRCRSRNFGDLKYCRYCGSRLRVAPPVESFVRPGEAAGPTPSPFIPVDVELAKRYAFEGKQHFAVGDLDRAAECFRRALDAAPGHPQLVGFLRRVGEIKARLLQAQTSTQSSSAPSAAPTAPVLRALPPVTASPRRRGGDVAATGPGARVLSLRRPPALSVVPSVAAAATEPQLACEPSPVAAVAVESPVRILAAAGSLSADPAAEIPAAAPGRSTSALAERRTGSRLLVADRPLSPALLMDRASGLEAWNETVAGVLVVAGLLVFGWILMFW